MQNVGPHCTFKSNLKKKEKKNFSRLTNPASRRASMDKQTIFFLGLMRMQHPQQFETTNGHQLPTAGNETFCYI